MFSKNRKIELLKSVPLFSGCSKKELERIAMIADEIDFRPGKTLIREGAPGREFFVLAEGTAEITREGKKIDTAGAGRLLRRDGAARRPAAERDGHDDVRRRRARPHRANFRDLSRSTR